MNITEKQIYHDNLLDKLFIWLLSRKIAKALGKTVNTGNYDDFVNLSQDIMTGRNSEEQQKMVETILKSVIPSPILYLIRTLFSPNKWVCETNAWFASRLFPWLVGLCDVKEVEVLDEHQKLRTQKSCVHIRKCRYLEASGCVGMCTNICKLPTQKFFTESFGIPVTMTPNFEDFSCDLVFGQTAPPFEEDPVFNQPCILTHCSTAKSNIKSCPKVD